MEKQNYHVTILANVPIQESVKKINRVDEWWTQTFEGSAENVGDTFKVTFGDTFVNFKVMETNPGKKMVWLATDCYLSFVNDRHEWTGTELLWELSDEKGKTKIDFTHVGLQPQVECYNDCEKGWNFYIKESLLKLLNENAGQPNKIHANA